MYRLQRPAVGPQCAPGQCVPIKSADGSVAVRCPGVASVVGVQEGLDSAWGPHGKPILERAERDIVLGHELLLRELAGLKLGHQLKPLFGGREAHGPPTIASLLIRSRRPPSVGYRSGAR